MKAKVEESSTRFSEKGWKVKSLWRLWNANIKRSKLIWSWITSALKICALKSPIAKKWMIFLKISPQSIQLARPPQKNQSQFGNRFIAFWKATRGDSGSDFQPSESQDSDQVAISSDHHTMFAFINFGLLTAKPTAILADSWRSSISLQFPNFSGLNLAHLLTKRLKVLPLIL